MARAPIRPGWLTGQPIAHRGFHRAAEGVIENTPTAARDAIARGYAIECDVQITADGEAVVFHDFTLDRLTTSSGPLAAATASQLSAVAYKKTTDSIVSLTDFLSLIGGATPLICEIKSAFDGDMRLTERTAQIVANYAGPVALKSFDPDIVAHLRGDGARLGVADRPLGLIAEASYEHPEWANIPAARRRDLAALASWPSLKPDFLSYGVRDLPHAGPVLVRDAGAPVMTWTVRTPEQLDAGRRWADQIVFEGFVA
jgi:glycerophosphoryl diester phosphodiesterase